MDRIKDDVYVKELTAQLVKAWESADVSDIDDMILPDAYIDFTIFGRDIGREKLKELLGERPRKTEFARFQLFNNVCLVEKGRAQQSVAMVGVYADPNEGEWTRFGFEGTFANSFVKTKEGWKFSAIKFQLTNEDSTLWCRLLTSGIAQVKGPGDLSFVSHWPYPKHDDRVGWHPGTRVPAINPEFDAPWYVIKNRENPGTEEEQIQEVYWKYAYGIDFDCFRLYDEVFTEDACIIYGDDRPYTKRSVQEFLKAERQGSCRCVHVGFFTEVNVDGNTAEGKLYLHGPMLQAEGKLTEELVKKRFVWARYNLSFAKENGQWKIRRMKFYLGSLEK